MPEIGDEFGFPMLVRPYLGLVERAGGGLVAKDDRSVGIFAATFSGSSSDAMGASTKPRLSGMQLQVLALYRGFLRAARTKSPEERSKIEALVSQEFRRNSSQVDRKNYLYIEYLVRRGKKQLDQLKSPETVGLASFNVEASQAKTS
ncbi:hypothetical protein AAHA92_19807 [Salvia divinorum]|uniref:Complex 1 LYR protein domain-containing protein n=1 Tax=Salvia divinorum TaxID=28513 RepID=A0ABD1GFH2_SALDI